MGRGDFFRHQYSQSYPHDAGKIDFSAEKRLLERLAGLPDEIPLDVLLSDELYESVEKGAFDNDAASVEQRQHLRDFLQSAMGGEATIQGLKSRLESHFVRLAKHALSHPEEFFSRGYMRNGGQDVHDVIVTSDTQQIIDVIRKISGQEHEKLVADLDVAIVDYVRGAGKQEHFTRITENNIKFEASREKHKRNEIENLEERRLNPFLRSKRRVDLRAIGQNRFVVQMEKGRQQADLLRIDWYHWVGSLDPENKKICDIGLDETGQILTVKNPLVLEFLNAALAKVCGNVVTVALPNLREGLDLNFEMPDMA